MRATRPQPTADDLLKLLRARHSKDVFVPECKDGATMTRAHRRLDAWALLPTWSPITAIGYEIKVSRADWLGDQKLGGYRGLAHLLYVVAPKGLIEPAELPPGFGLLEPAGERLVTRRKAVRDEVELPPLAHLMLYVLQYRAAIKGEGEVEAERLAAKRRRFEEIRAWAAQREERRGIQSLVSAKIVQELGARDREIMNLQGLLTIARSRPPAHGMHPADRRRWRLMIDRALADLGQMAEEIDRQPRSEG